MSNKQYWDNIYKGNDKVNSDIYSYWNHYSDMGNWQFWFAVALLVVPIIILFFTIDRRRLFELLFFGYTVHMMWTYTDLPLQRHGFFVHKYFITPVLPFALSLTAAALPVVFILTYQYCTNRNKNFYLYAILVSAIFTFGFGAFEKYIGLAEFRKGMNQFWLFLIDLVIVFVSYWFTKILLKWRRIFHKVSSLDSKSCLFNIKNKWTYKIKSYRSIFYVKLRLENQTMRNVNPKVEYHLKNSASSGRCSTAVIELTGSFTTITNKIKKPKICKFLYTTCIF